MKKSLSVALIALFFAMINIVKAQTVYVAETGKKYHSKMCSSATGKKGMELAAAKKEGYTACSKCNPDKKMEEKEVKKEEKKGDKKDKKEDKKETKDTKKEEKKGKKTASK